MAHSETLRNHGRFEFPADLSLPFWLSSDVRAGLEFQVHKPIQSSSFISLNSICRALVIFGFTERNYLNLTNKQGFWNYEQSIILFW